MDEPARGPTAEGQVPSGGPTDRALVYEAPAIVWEETLVALTACSPPCQPPFVCNGDICLDPGG